jgi:hypothetical protein
MIARVWRFVTLFGRVLFACRVSLLSALGGLALLGLALQAQNLFADLSHGWLYWPLFFVALFFVWAFPVHYGARTILDEDGWMVGKALRRALPGPELRSLIVGLRAELAGVILWLPRFLGLLPFVAVGLGLWFADRAMDGARVLPDAARAHEQIIWLSIANVIVGALFIAFVIWRRPAIAKEIAHLEGPHGLHPGRGRMEKNLVFLEWLSIAGTTLVFVVAYFLPHWLSAHIPRAMLIPFLFGSPVLLLSLLARYGDRCGFPVLTPILILCALVTATNSHFNDLRLLPPDPVQHAGRQIEVAEAVRLWRAANHCSGADCPAALIVAAEGGASRAAFMEATLLGEIMDRAKAKGLAPGRMIFAISGVSGGAYGAAVVRAALTEAAQSDHAPPCRHASPTWFGAGKPEIPSARTSWRSCLQALVSGDYLSSGFIGLGFRDTFAPRQWFIGEASWLDDRAALLEQSWEAHFRRVTGVADGAKGLSRPLGYIDKTGDWLPLLLLNGTSVETGRRIIATDFVSTARQTDVPSRLGLYSAAYDFFEMLSTPCAVDGAACPRGPRFPDDDPEARNAPDVRLSTAALLSARFPIISPAGILRGKDVDMGDRVVDGGYFENAGMTTALDLAEALKREKVTPAILWVQNDPIGARVIATTPPRPTATPSVGPLDRSLSTATLGILASPVDTLIATRAGHGAEAADMAVQTLARLNGDDRLGFFAIGVRERPEIAPVVGGDPSFEAECGALGTALAGTTLAMTKVSMSWWLSEAVQADLDAQFCDKGNRSGLDDLLKFITRPAK